MKNSRIKQVEVAYLRKELRFLMLRSFKQMSIIDSRLKGNTDKYEIEMLESYRLDLNNYVNSLSERLEGLRYE